MTDVVLAVDGGNSKTDLALVSADGTVLAAVRGGGTSPHHLGLPAALARIAALYDAALATAGLTRPVALGVLALAGADLPAEEVALQAAVEEQGWARRSVVRNDTFAVLRSGTDAACAVAVVCGAGINCVGVARDGREERFLALGTVTGDWGGGYDLGLGALGAAVRAEDGRDPATVLTGVVAGHFALPSASDVAIAFHGHALSGWRLAELSPLVLSAAADGDGAAGALVDRLGDEVAAFAVAAARRLGLDDEPVDVVLGGGILRAGWARLDARVAAAVSAALPRARLVRAPHPPLAGCALLALDAVGAGPDAADRLREQFRSGAVALTEVVGPRADEPMRRLATG